MVAWCILAIASSFSENGKPDEGGYTCLLAFGFVLAVLFPVRWLARQVYTMYERQGGIDENLMFASLLFLMLVVLAFTAEEIGMARAILAPNPNTGLTYAGIHSFFGAFLAGMIVPKEGGLPERLIPRIELVICLNPLHHRISVSYTHLTLPTIYSV